ncbi:unnamed protein product [Leptosia nina]|uniref:Aftiphilin clathrin-binding box domain-containing protein n=1 Tax=Leptosia nina TaxID=320188 RepID=A0AAV1JMD0_9NEOP
MSIPPLVCSTPPPPDQCEDDKNIEEFDLEYNLSQDEEDIYNYGSFSNFNDYDEGHSYNGDLGGQHKITALDKLTGDKASEAIQTESSNFVEQDNMALKCDDIVIEDLNLKIEKGNILKENIETDEANEDNEADITCFVEDTEAVDKTISDNILVTDNNTKENDIEKITSTNNIFPTNNSMTEEEMMDDIVVNDDQKDVESDLNQNLSSDINLCKKSDTDIAVTDDFDKFEDFHFTTVSQTTYDFVENVGNPWENNDSEDIGFGDFKANFDSGETKQEELRDQQSIENSNTQVTLDNFTDDDFGDFDDFKSSVKDFNPTVVNEQMPPHVTVLNLQANDNEAQAVESITNILTNIFTEDMPHSEKLFEGNLDKMLSETWHHLKDVDERQPYIVYWNNSLGQKTLLKALCIDSRNILFGPKRNYFTPKYATNLSTAPLKPQKPVSTPNMCNQSDSVHLEKSNKENPSWSEADGQESNITEKEPKIPRSSDMDVLGNTISVTDIEKIHSSTLSVQPLRHINLPDTHIFTPTDSETPRSKTIHYDERPSVLFSQPNVNNKQINVDAPRAQHSNVENSDDYWEFQDFKGASATDEQNFEAAQPEEKIDVSNSPPTIKNVTYQIQMLQPMKVEPIIPTLNWPDPGEVKETFDDFSDFISNTTWNNDTPNSLDTNSVLPNEVISVSKEDIIVNDGFESFQSATPTYVSNNYDLFKNAEPNNHNVMQSEPINAVPSEVNMFDMKNNEILSPKYVKSQCDSPTNASVKPGPANILQPISNNPSTVMRPQQGGQILQPLSLESYSQINWPKPGIDLQNLASFNPLESLDALKSDSGSSGASKGPSPVHKVSSIQSEVTDDDIWGDFVSSKPKQSVPKKSAFADDDEWTDFVSSPSISQNSLKTISFNVETNTNLQKSSNQNSTKYNQISLDIPTLNYITPKSNSRGLHVDKHFQNL